MFLPMQEIHSIYESLCNSFPLNELAEPDPHGRNPQALESRVHGPPLTEAEKVALVSASKDIRRTNHENA
jgi:hypothetical protein